MKAEGTIHEHGPQAPASVETDFISVSINLAPGSYSFGFSFIRKLSIS